MEEKAKKNGFASGIGFILAAAGSAVGLGNIWAFPHKVGSNGGAAFVLVYIFCVIFIGAIAMMSEIFIGKRAQANTVSAYKKVKKGLGWFGLIVIIVPTLITCYYSVLGGWTMRFAVNSFQAVESANNAVSFGAFSSNAVEPIFYTLVFMVLAAIIIMAGVKNGIEKSSKILMPILFIILVAIVIICLCLGDGVDKGLEFYLKPDFTELGFDGVVAAMGQAFFSLSLGMGTMMAYGSYTGKEIKIGKSTAMICLFDSLVAFLAGLAIFPAIGALDPAMLEKASGVGLVYQILPKVFAEMGGVGQVVSFAFFAMIVIAALTSVISIMEVSVQFIIQKFKVSRKKTTLCVALFCTLASIPIAWSVGGAFGGSVQVFGFDLLTFLDEIANTVLMPVGAFGACLAVGWFMDKKLTLNPMKTYRTLESEDFKIEKIGKLLVVMLKYVTPLFILFVEVTGVMGKINSIGAKYWWVIIFALAIIVIAVACYFIFLKNRDCGTNEDEIELKA